MSTLGVWKHIIKPVLLPALLALLVANPLQALVKTRVAVMDLKTKGVKENVAAILTDSMRAEIYRSDVFDLMNREDMVAILGEVAFQQSGACESTSCMVEMGSALGVEKIITGSVGLLGERYSVTMKLIDIETQRNEALYTRFFSGRMEDLPEFIQSLAGRLIEAEFELAKLRGEIDHNPGKAAGLGFLPGAGQYYNQQRGKAYLFAAAAGICLTGVIFSHRLAGVAQEYYEGAGEHSDFDSLYNDWERKQKVNRIFVWASVVVVGASVLDAYISAQKFKPRVACSSDGEETRVSYALEF